MPKEDAPISGQRLQLEEAAQIPPSWPSPVGLMPWTLSHCSQRCRLSPGMYVGHHCHLGGGRVMTTCCPKGHVHLQGHHGRTVVGCPNDRDVPPLSVFSCEERGHLQKPTRSLWGGFKLRNRPERSTTRPPLGEKQTFGEGEPCPVLKGSLVGPLRCQGSAQVLSSQAAE